MPETRLSEQAIQALGLSSHPFAAPQKIEAFFMTQSLQMLLNIVRQHLSEDNMLLVVKGEHGVGKSCFAQLLELNAAGNLIFNRIKGSNNVTSAQLLQQIQPQNVSDDPEEITKHAALHLFKQIASHKQAVMLLDNAHSLPFKSLHTLFKFLRAVAHQGRGYVKLLLLGENSIDAKLDKIDAQLLDKSNIFSTLLRSLNKQQTEDYIHFCLQQAGMAKAEHVLSGKQLEQIYQASGGVPLAINRAVIDALNKLSVKPHHKLLGLFSSQHP